MRVCITLLGIVAVLVGRPSHAQWQSMELASGVSASIRGLSVLSDSVVWVGGGNGTILYTNNMGYTWVKKSIPDCPKCDFRTVYAQDEGTVIVANAGFPAKVYLTQDTGTSWTRVFEWTDSSAFIDGIAFFNRRQGIIYGDPINGRLRLLKTNDSGRSWQEVARRHCPVLIDGEASFAASGTTITTFGRRTVVIATGGKQSRLLVSRNRGRRWQSISTPILQGTASAGIFSVVALSARHWIIVGGDYLNDTMSARNCFYTTDGGRTWLPPTTSPRGYRECIVQTADNMLLAVGPSGVDYSDDKGVNWRPCSDVSNLHVARPLRRSRKVIVAGGAGKILILLH